MTSARTSLTSWFRSLCLASFLNLVSSLKRAPRASEPASGFGSSGQGEAGASLSHIHSITTRVSAARLAASGDRREPVFGAWRRRRVGRSTPGLDASPAAWTGRKARTAHRCTRAVARGPGSRRLRPFSSPSLTSCGWVHSCPSATSASRQRHGPVAQITQRGWARP